MIKEIKISEELEVKVEKISRKVKQENKEIKSRRDEMGKSEKIRNQFSRKSENSFQPIFKPGYFRK